MKNLKLAALFLTMGFIFVGCSGKNEAHTVVNIDKKEGLLKDDGQVAIKPVYKNLKTFHGDFEKYDHPNYLNIHWIHDSSDKSYAIVEDINKKYGIINKEGELKLKIIYDEIGTFFNGFAKIEVNGKYGFINEDFEVVLKPIFDEVQQFVYETSIVRQGDKYGCIDKNMDLKIKPTFDMIYIQSEGFKRVELNDKWGFLDSSCEIAVKPVFDYAYDYKNGFAKVQEGKKWGFLDKKGKLLTKQIFDDPDRF